MRLPTSAIAVFLVPLVLSFGVAVADTMERIEILDEFWAYPSSKVQEAISSPWSGDLTTEEIESLSTDLRTAYRLLQAGTCSVEEPAEEYLGLYQYRCHDRPLWYLFAASTSEERVLLFTKPEDAPTVIGYLGRYVDFLRAEDSLRGGMPIGAEYVEYLLELQRVLEDSHSPAEAGGEGAESSALSAMGHDSR